MCNIIVCRFPPNLTFPVFNVRCNCHVVAKVVTALISNYEIETGKGITELTEEAAVSRHAWHH